MSIETVSTFFYTALVGGALVLIADTPAEMFLFLAAFAVVRLLTSIVDGRLKNTPPTVLRTWRSGSIALLIAGVTGTLLGRSIPSPVALAICLSLLGALMCAVTVSDSRAHRPTDGAGEHRQPPTPE